MLPGVERGRLSKSALVGGVFIVAGVLFLLFGWPDAFRPAPIRYEILGETADAGQAPVPEGHYPVDHVTRFRISHRDGGSLRLDTLAYRDQAQQPRTAVVFPSADGVAKAEGGGSGRMALWREAAAAINRQAPEQALFVSWWDNAQRVQFMTGRVPWIGLPVAAAYPDPQTRDFWEQAGGGFDADERKTRQLARWLTMEADQALAEMEQQLPHDRPVYLLVSLDDLARLAEIEALAGTRLPFEASLFPQTGDIHRQIAGVRQWAGEKGVGSYLVQQLPTGGVRAWRITTEAGTQSLLARLLPFTTSVAQPLRKVSLVYQSRWGGYLSIYQWHP